MFVIYLTDDLVIITSLDSYNKKCNSIFINDVKVIDLIINYLKQCRFNNQEIRQQIRVVDSTQDPIQEKFTICGPRIIYFTQEIIQSQLLPPYKFLKLLQNVNASLKSINAKVILNTHHKDNKT